MKFNGKFIVTKRVDARDLVLKQNADLKSTEIQGSLTVTGPSTFHDNAVINTFSGKDDDALANQKYIKEHTTDVVLRESNTLTPADGKNGDIAFEGRLNDQEAEYNFVPDDATFYTYVRKTGDGDHIMRQSNININPVTITRTTDGINWTQDTWTLPNKMYDGPHIYPTGEPGGYFIMPGYLDRGNPERRPMFTHDNGVTWTRSSQPYNGSFVTAAVNATTQVIGGNFRAMYSTNGGASFAYSNYNALSNAPISMRYKNIVAMAASGNRVILVNDKQEIWISTNGGQYYAPVLTPNISQSETNNIKFYNDDNCLFGGNHGFYSIDVSTRTVTPLTLPDRNMTGMYVRHIGLNTITKRAVIIMFKAGAKPELIAYSADIPETGIMTNFKRIPSDIDGRNVDVSIGYMATYDTHTYGIARAGKLTYLTIDADATFMTARLPALKARLTDLYTKYDNKWLKYTPDVTTTGDARYASKDGGEIGALTLTDNIDLNGNKLVDVPDPVKNTDIVNKQYVDTLISGSAGGAIDITVGTSSTTIDTTPGSIETMVYSISANHSTGRYYSRVNVTADGNTNPTSAEYAVLSIGGLDITVDVEKAGNGDTLLKATSNQSNTKLRVKREIIDL